MRFKNLDLNLLVLLSSLLSTRSVSESGRRLNLSQPAVSGGLSRLRDYFGDPLFVTYGRRMAPTPFAEGLGPLVARAMAEIEAVVSATTAFDPATSRRLFRIGASDYVSLVLIGPLLERLQAEAPGVAIHIVAPSEQMFRRLAAGDLDFIVTPEEFQSPDHASRLLFEERHVVVGWTGNPVMDAAMTEEVFFACGHVAVEIGSERRSSFGERHLAMLGKHRRVEVTAGSFAVAPWLLPGTMRLALMHERLARLSAKVLPLRVAEVPFDFPVMRQMVQLHRAREGDPGVTWLLESLSEQAARGILEP